MDPHRDELVDGDSLVAEPLEVADELGRDAVDPHRDESVGGDALVSEVAERADVLRRDAVDAERDEAVDRRLLVSERRHRAGKFRSRAVDPHRDQALGRKVVVAERAQVREELAADVVDRVGIDVVLAEARVAERLPVLLELRLAANSKRPEPPDSSSSPSKRIVPASRTISKWTGFAPFPAGRDRPRKSDSWKDEELLHLPCVELLRIVSWRRPASRSKSSSHRPSMSLSGVAAGTPRRSRSRRAGRVPRVRNGDFRRLVMSSSRESARRRARRAKASFPAEALAFRMNSAVAPWIRREVSSSIEGAA